MLQPLYFQIDLIPGTKLLFFPKRGKPLLAFNHPLDLSMHGWCFGILFNTIQTKYPLILSPLFPLSHSISLLSPIFVYLSFPHLSSSLFIYIALLFSCSFPFPSFMAAFTFFNSDAPLLNHYVIYQHETSVLIT